MNFRPAFFRLSVLLGVVAWLGLGICEEAAARAGGAGGDSSSKGSSKSSGSNYRSNKSSGSSYSGKSGGSYRSNRSSGSSYSGSGGGGYYDGTEPVWVMVLRWMMWGIPIGSALLLAAILIRRHWKANKPDPGVRPRPPVPVGREAFLAANPDFDPALFVAKVRSAFMKIQKAWTAQEIAQVRPFISDGMYQRFATQFRMMGLLKQRNVLDKIIVHGVHPIAFRNDGGIDVIDVWIHAVMSDSFTCELDPSMNSEGHDPFVEYWSFIRKRGALDSGFNLFSAENCPSCGAELPRDMGELCRCSHCQVLVNSGEFDWVLAEITQEGDYRGRTLLGARVPLNLPAVIAAIEPECPDFSMQLLEDKASNAFMQIMTSWATRNPVSVRRFTTDEVFTGISELISSPPAIAFARIYLNEAVLLHVTRDATQAKHRIDVGLSASMRRVELFSDGRFRPLDWEEKRSLYTLSMERDIDAVPEKGSLYQHQCSTCGGRVGDTIDVTCQYCGSLLNSTRNEWIVCGFREN